MSIWRDRGRCSICFSEALRILDRNTAELMVDRMKDEIDELKAQAEENKAQLEKIGRSWK